MINSGERVAVLDENGTVLFTGTLADTRAPWMFWTRVVPDQQYIDLPPRYKVVADKDVATGGA